MLCCLDHWLSCLRISFSPYGIPPWGDYHRPHQVCLFGFYLKQSLFSLKYKEVDFNIKFKNKENKKKSFTVPKSKYFISSRKNRQVCCCWFVLHGCSTSFLKYHLVYSDFAMVNFLSAPVSCQTKIGTSSEKHSYLLCLKTG